MERQLSEMSDYSEIFRKLTQNQIMRLLADFRMITDDEYRGAGIPAVVIGRVTDAGDGTIPSPAAVMSSWDPAVMKQTAAAAADGLLRTGVDLALIPSPAVGISPLSDRMTEDRLLARMYAQAYRDAMAEAVIPFAVENVGLTVRDADWMGDTPDSMTAHDALADCMSGIFSEEIGCLGSTVDMSDEREAVRGAGLEAADKLPGYVFCTDIRPGDSVKLLERGCILVGGNVSELSAAASRYNDEKREIDAGRRAPDRLNQLLADGEALSNETIQKALERILDVAFRVRQMTAGQKEPAVETSALPAQVLSSCVVLLRNQGILPFMSAVTASPKSLPQNTDSGTGGTTAVIGDLRMTERENEDEAGNAFGRRMSDNGLGTIVFSRGYDASACDGGEDLIREACAAAADADGEYEVYRFRRCPWRRRPFLRRRCRHGHAGRARLPVLSGCQGTSSENKRACHLYVSDGQKI